MKLDDICQGLILDVPAVAVIEPGSDDAGPAVADVSIESGLCVVLTQTCDAVRDTSTEPYLHAAPVMDVDEETWARAYEGRLSPRRFALPAGLRGLAWPVVDIRWITTIDKRLVLDDQLTVKDRLPAGLKQPFAIWLGRRWARYAFDDDVETDILGPVRQLLAERYSSDKADGALVRSIVGVYLNQMDRTLTLLLLVEPGTKSTSQFDDPAKIRVAGNLLFKNVFKRARENGWELTTPVREPTELDAFELLYTYQQVEIDIPDQDAES